MSEALELRVLSGLHRDARCLAADGAVLGADPACDIVLADDGMGPRAARLRIGETGWDLANDDGAPADPAGGQPRTPFNRPVPLGPVWITVARRGDPGPIRPTPPTMRWAAAQRRRPPPTMRPPRPSRPRRRPTRTKNVCWSDACRCRRYKADVANATPGRCCSGWRPWC
ncbi:hypothetical protein WJ978_11155 [Achromobacter xylosoxidans]